MKLFQHSFTLLRWLLIQPSLWRQYVTKLDDSISPNFALVDLSWSHWKNRRLQFTLIAGYAVIPAVLIAITVSGIPLGIDTRGALTGYLFVYLLALCVGLYNSFPASVLFLFIGSIVTTITWTGSRVIMFDVTAGIDLGFLFGSCSACMILAAAHHDHLRSDQSVIRQIGAVILGLLVSIPLVTAVIFLILTATAGRQAGTLHGSWIMWTLMLPPLLLSLAIILLRTRKIRRTLLPTLFCLFVFSSGFGELGYEYDRSTGGFALLSSIMTVALSTFCMMAFTAYSLLRPFVGDLPASVTAAAGGLAIHFGIHASLTFYPLLENLLIAVVIIAAAMSFKYTWSVLSYPFEAAWNRLLIELDTRRSGPAKHLHRLSFNWDEVQFFPFFELTNYLVTVAEKQQDASVHDLKRVSQA